MATQHARLDGEGGPGTRPMKRWGPTAARPRALEVLDDVAHRDVPVHRRSRASRLWANPTARRPTAASRSPARVGAIRRPLIPPLPTITTGHGRVPPRDGTQRVAPTPTKRGHHRRTSGRCAEAHLGCPCRGDALIHEQRSREMTEARDRSQERVDCLECGAATPLTIVTWGNCRACRTAQSRPPPWGLRSTLRGRRPAPHGGQTL